MGKSNDLMDLGVATQGNEGAKDLLTQIFAQQERDANNFQAQLERVENEKEAKALLLADGVHAAIAQREIGGTTSSYELMVDRISAVLHASEWMSPHLKWYITQVEERRKEAVSFGSFYNREVHPDYKLFGVS